MTRATFKTTRSVNPLAPTYVVRDDKNEQVTIGEIKGSSPAKLPQRQDKSYFGCMNLRDIPGTAAGSKRLGAFHSTQRRNFLNPNAKTEDIQGAQVSTVKIGIQSTRRTDPLNPQYQIPGATEQANIDSDPFGGSSLDPRFVAARKAMDAREAAMKASKVSYQSVPALPVIPMTPQAATLDNKENTNTHQRPVTAAAPHSLVVAIKKPTADEVVSSKGFSIKPAQVDAKPASVRGPRSNASSAKSRMSAAQKLDQFITNHV